MENYIIHSDIDGRKIKPADAFLYYKELTQKDVQERFKKLEASNCPACEAKDFGHPFDSMGIPYGQCSNCLTVYATSRPSEDDIEQFYLNSPARSFWGDVIWKNSEEERIQKILTPLVDWIAREYSQKEKNQGLELATLNATHPVLQNLLQKQQFTCRDKRPYYENQEGPATANVDGVVLIDTLDRAHQPSKLLQQASSFLKERGKVHLTFTLSTGIDFLELGQHHPQLFPPDRLNCLSYEGACQLFEKNGFTIEEFSTPGVLDLQYLEQNVQKIHSPSLKYLLEKRNSEFEKKQTIEFLQKNKLSSLARVQLKKGRSL